jgi:hypothetical protein
MSLGSLGMCPRATQGRSPGSELLSLLHLHYTVLAQCLLVSLHQHWLLGWWRGSSGRAPASKHEARSSNPSIAKNKKETLILALQQA